MQVVQSTDDAGSVEDINAAAAASEGSRRPALCCHSGAELVSPPDVARL